jgi:hypothetical protein
MDLPLEDLAKVGNKFYLETLASELEPDHNGEYVVIEVESGDYYLDANLLEAITKAQEAHPNTLFHIVQVGGVSKAALHKVKNSAWLF